jgi:hypothetical protein
MGKRFGSVFRDDGVREVAFGRRSAAVIRLPNEEQILVETF